MGAHLDGCNESFEDSHTATAPATRLTKTKIFHVVLKISHKLLAAHERRRGEQGLRTGDGRAIAD